MATFNGTEGAPIPLAIAKEWTANYRKTIKPDGTLAHYFGGDIIQRILKEPGCVGIRIYYAINERGQKELLLVGSDKNGDNLLPSESKQSVEGDDPIIADNSRRCPPDCPNNAL